MLGKLSNFLGGALSSGTNEVSLAGPCQKLGKKKEKEKKRKKCMEGAILVVLITVFFPFRITTSRATSLER